ncbi:hypothetical protein [Clostridium formicaceticum]|uniref:Uncharacterized protein n=1 Tax=Clostridium formicaceticum TaxID=1497 RepID=A0AAC9WEW7_9CLOT|nr:hypothetical protein [Clostridium formicaceticum]AOY75876.1 hypothetical protein BJL90_08205 [Clostridium formicaceticum]ARE86217.1 hypothetical protein CLFO_05390 [Clostridium formicaceticum]
MEEEKIYEALKKIRKKYWFQRLLQYMAYAILCFGTTILLLACISHMKVITGVRGKGISFMAGYAFFALLMALWKRPSLLDAAKLGDAMGFKERFCTYLQYREREDQTWYCFLEEMEEALEEEKPYKSYQVKGYSKLFFLGIAVFCIGILVFYLPTAPREAAYEREKINQEIRKEVLALEEILKEFQEEEITLGKEEKNQGIEAVKILKKELNKAYQYHDAAWEIQKTQDRLVSIYGEDFLSKNFSSTSREISNIDAGNNPSQRTDGEEGDFEKKDNLEGFADLQQKDRLSTHMDRTNKKLEEMKQRMLSKEEDGLKSKPGQDSIENFAAGETEAFERAEASRQSGEKVTEGGFGEENSRESGGVGGSAAGNQGDATFKEEGSIGSEGEAFSLEGENFVEAAFSGRESEKGDFQQRGVTETLGIEGMEENRLAYYKDFIENPVGYLDRYGVPSANKNLVINYFKELEGE